MKTTGDQQLVKRINRSVLLRQLRAQPGLSRAQLATESGLTKSTVSLLVRELIDEGWVTETDVTTTQTQGRPSTPLHIDTRSRGLIGVEVAVEALRVVGVSLNGQVLCAAEEALNGTKPDDVCRQAARLIARTYKQLQQRNIEALGVGVGLPGAFDEATGMLRFAPNLGWRNVDLMPPIAEALAKAKLPQLKVHLQNEADTAALSEYEFSDGDAKDSLIFVTCGVGVGAGIVLNDRLFTGVQGMAGEIGHNILQIDGPLCSCGRRGCAETFFGARTLAKLPDPTQGGHYLGVGVAKPVDHLQPQHPGGGRPLVRHLPGHRQSRARHPAALRRCSRHGRSHRAPCALRPAGIRRGRCRAGAAPRAASHAHRHPFGRCAPGRQRTPFSHHNDNRGLTMFLGIDIGTSEVKALLLSDDHRIIGSAGTSLSVSRPHPGHSEQNPADWWAATQSALLKLQAAHPADYAAVRAIGLSGQMHGAVLLDAQDRVLRPAILWNDTRCALECTEMMDALPGLTDLAGSLAMPGFTAPKLRWVAKHEPEVFQQVAKVLLPKDYVRLMLTGEYACDMSDASGTLWLDVQSATGLTHCSPLPT